jgi:hypothetical protein
MLQRTQVLVREGRCPRSREQRMRFSLDANLAIALIIEHAPQASPLCPNIAVNPGNNQV